MSDQSDNTAKKPASTVVGFEQKNLSNLRAAEKKRAASKNGSAKTITRADKVRNSRSSLAINPVDRGYEVETTSFEMKGVGTSGDLAKFETTQNGTYAYIDKEAEIQIDKKTGVETQLRSAPTYWDVKRICDLPVRPVGRLSTTEDEGSHEYAVFEVATLNHPVRVTLPSHVLTNIKSPKNPEREKLLSLGVPEDPNLCRRLYQVFRYAADNGLIENREGTRKAGWAKDRSAHLRSGHENYLSIHDEPEMIEFSGDFEVQKETFEKMMKGNNVSPIFFGAAMSGYLRGYVPTIKDTNILAASGATSMGKTIISTAISSIQSRGSSESPLLASSRSSMPGVETLLTANNHGFIAIDDLNGLLDTAKNKKEAMQDLMHFTNCTGRNLSKANGNARNVKRWNCTIIASSNEFLSGYFQGLTQDEALRARVFEIDIDEHPLFGEGASQGMADMLDQAVDALSSNYGHLYSKAVEHLTEKNRSLEYQQLINDFVDQCKKAYSDDDPVGLSGVARRRAEMLGSFYAGMHLFHQFIDFDLKGACNKLRSLFEAEITDSDERRQAEAEKVYSNVTSYLNANLPNIKVEGHLATKIEHLSDAGKQKHIAEQHSEGIKTFGVIQQKEPMKELGEFTGIVAIPSVERRSGQRDVVVDMGAMAREAKALDALQVNKSEPKRHDKKFRGQRHYMFDMGRLLEIMNESQDEYPDPFDMSEATVTYSDQGDEIPFG